MKAAERAVVVKVLAKTVRKVRAEYEKQIADLRSEVVELRSVTEESIAALESATADIKALPIPKDGEPGPKGDKGDSVTVEGIMPALMPELMAELRKAVSEIPAPKDGNDGKSVTVDDIRPILEAETAKALLDLERRAHTVLHAAVDKIQVPKDGKDGRDADPAEVAKRVIEQLELDGDDLRDVERICRELVKEHVARIELPEAEKPTDEQVSKAVDEWLSKHPPRNGEDGQSVTAEDVMPAIMEHVQEALDAIPAPKDGDSVTAEDVLPELRAEVKRLVEEIPRPKDGEPGKDGTGVTVDDVLPTLMERVDEHLKSLPVPQDGASVTLEDALPELLKALKSMESEWALDFEKRAQAKLEKAAESIPKPKDGRNAFELEDIDLSIGDDGRTLTFRWKRGEEVVERSVVLHYPLDRGVYKDGTEYVRGDGVSYGGSFWIAQKDAPKGKPGQANRDWRLTIKRGRDGRSSGS